MCDEGMLSYKRAHDDRMTQARIDSKPATLPKAVAKAAALLQDVPADTVAVVLSAQHSNEDNFALMQLAKAAGFSSLFLSGVPHGEGDAILRHVDKNPNTAGARQVAGANPGTFQGLLDAVESGKVKHVVALGSATPLDATSVLKQLTTLIVAAPWDGPLADAADVFLPACSWAEADGTFVNAKGIAQVSHRAIQPVDDARPAWQLMAELAKAMGHEMSWKTRTQLVQAMPAAAQPAPAAGDEQTETKSGQASAEN
jgi:NADH-quinone oxidoreductase subunit G